jgi:hypothetical protein
VAADQAKDRARRDEHATEHQADADQIARVNDSLAIMRLTGDYVRLRLEMDNLAYCVAHGIVSR